VLHSKQSVVIGTAVVEPGPHGAWQAPPPHRMSHDRVEDV
jgi:hypothetical protein